GQVGASLLGTNAGASVCSLGGIVHTTNGGSRWVNQSSAATMFSLDDVSFSDANNGTAVGDSGTILHTTDAGRTWVSQTSSTTNTLLGVSFSDANTGTAVGEF